ncbi:hypothetical protein Hanom_Chr09g00848711 [Helianthus anomalus]
MVTLDVLLDKMNFMCPYACWKRLYRLCFRSLMGAWSLLFFQDLIQE